MPKSDFIYGNFDTAGLAWCYKLHPIHFPTPERDVTVITIPGRDGDVVEDNGCYKNVNITVELVIEATGQKDFIEYFDILKNAIESQAGYQRIEDSFYPDEFCYGYVTKIERDQSDTQNGKVVLSINCKPQRFLKSGEIEIDLNFTSNPTGGTNYVPYADLPQGVQTEVDALGLTGAKWGIYPIFTLARDADYVFMNSPRDGWINPNDSTSYGYWRYTGNYRDTGDTFYTSIGFSPFLSICDESGEIYTPSYYSTPITNPTNQPASPLITVYGQIGCWINTAFGIDADNYVQFYAKDTGRVTSDRIFYIDCADFDAYTHSRMTGEIINYNTDAFFHGELTIPPGKSNFRVSNFQALFTDIDRITIKPRWWRI